MKPPTVFLSYSQTKTPDKNVLGRVLLEIKECLKRSEWAFSDPLESAGDEGQGIRERVASHIYAADAVFAECSMAVPNVMFEIGFARALRYPIVFFVNKDIHHSAPDSIKEHLHFIGINED